MTLQTEARRMDYVSTGGVDYPYTFKVFDETHLLVYVDGTLVALTTDYTVSGVGETGGGTVTLVTAPTVGDLVTILRRVPATQLTDYVENDPFAAETHENALDKLTMIAQEHEEKLDRAVSLEPTSTYQSPTLDDPVTGTYLRWTGTSPPVIGGSTITPDTGIGLPLATTEGGWGQDVSAETGFVKLTAGTPSFIPLLDAGDLIPAAYLGTSPADGAYLRGDQTYQILPIPAARNDFRLTLSTGLLTLAPVDGRGININGTERLCTVTPTLAATALTIDTVYYVYAAWSGTDITLEASTTGYTVGTTGRPEQTGDVTKRLVGMAYCVTGPAWSTAPTLVLSYNHRRLVSHSAAFTVDRSTTATSATEINAEIRVPFLTFGDESILASATCPATITTVGNVFPSAFSQLRIDATTALALAGSGNYVTGQNEGMSMTLVGHYLAPLGYHYATVFGWISQDTLKFLTGGSVHVAVRG